MKFLSTLLFAICFVVVSVFSTDATAQECATCQAAKAVPMSVMSTEVVAVRNVTRVVEYRTRAVVRPLKTVMLRAKARRCSRIQRRLARVGC